jgi:hypothetical protein
MSKLLEKIKKIWAEKDCKQVGLAIRSLKINYINLNFIIWFYSSKNKERKLNRIKSKRHTAW